MPEIMVQGRRMAYEAQPVQFDNNSLAAVFIHGSGGDREDWRAQLTDLSAVCTIIALELPGHGLSDPPGESTVPAFSDWVAAFIEAMRLKQVVLVGCSLGSAITQWIALTGKPWLKGIALVGGGARLRVHPSFLTGLRETPEKSLEEFSGYALRESSDESLKNEIRARFAKCSPELVYNDLYACDKFDVMESIGGLDIPVSIIVGEHDRLTPLKYSQFLHKAIAGSELNILPAAGHLVMIENPKDFNKCLGSFLRRIGRNS